jgi:hypothetical protein
MSCQFCGKPAENLEGLQGVEAAVCPSCMELLKTPTTALPLIRGHLTLTLRGKVPEAELKRKVDAFMQMISTWKRPG